MVHTGSETSAAQGHKCVHHFIAEPRCPPDASVSYFLPFSSGLTDCQCKRSTFAHARRRMVHPRAASRREPGHYNHQPRLGRWCSQTGLGGPVRNTANADAHYRTHGPRALGADERGRLDAFILPDRHGRERSRALAVPEETERVARSAGGGSRTRWTCSHYVISKGQLKGTYR